MSANQDSIVGNNNNSSNAHTNWYDLFCTQDLNQMLLQCRNTSLNPQQESIHGKKVIKPLTVNNTLNANTIDKEISEKQMQSLINSDNAKCDEENLPPRQQKLPTSLQQQQTQHPMSNSKKTNHIDSPKPSLNTPRRQQQQDNIEVLYFCNFENCKYFSKQKALVQKHIKSAHQQPLTQRNASTSKSSLSPESIRIATASPTSTSPLIAKTFKSPRLTRALEPLSWSSPRPTPLNVTIATTQNPNAHRNGTTLLVRPSPSLSESLKLFNEKLAMVTKLSVKRKQRQSRMLQQRQQ